MEHSPDAKREEDNELPTNVFNLEKLSTDQVRQLISAFGAAFDANEASESPRPFGGEAAQLLGVLEGDLKELADRAPEKAKELFMAFTNDSEWRVRDVAIASLTNPLILEYHQASNYETRQAIIDRCLELMDDKESLVRESATETLSVLVSTSEWLDEPTRCYLDTKLPEGWRSFD